MGIFKFFNGTLRVNDLSQSLEFYRDVLGLHEIAKENDTIYLGCGADSHYDVAIKQGGTGIDVFSLQVRHEEDLKYFSQKLSKLGVSSERRSDTDPGKKSVLRFMAPTKHQIELVYATERPHYLHPIVGHKGSKGLDLMDADHITLHAQDVQGLAQFLQEGLDFSVSDVFEPAPGVWGAAWTHASDFHHDVAIVGTPEHTTLHHYAFLLKGFDDLKRSADLLAQAGYKLETAPGRHSVGGNLYTYFFDPSGNRIELSAEMPRADLSAQPRVWDDFPTAFSSWGIFPPESFGKGS
ncbi:VOC family protein [Neobacillus niacini]|uniref:VOC family protein n=1 Tax=Neobacillus niacini TaxID=86668 RepID=UPI0030029D80